MIEIKNESKILNMSLRDAMMKAGKLSNHAYTYDEDGNEIEIKTPELSKAIQKFASSIDPKMKIGDSKYLSHTIDPDEDYDDILGMLFGGSCPCSVCSGLCKYDNIKGDPKEVENAEDLYGLEHY